MQVLNNEVQEPARHGLSGSNTSWHGLKQWVKSSLICNEAFKIVPVKKEQSNFKAQWPVLAEMYFTWGFGQMTPCEATCLTEGAEGAREWDVRSLAKP
eukprot:1136198-Pelagomonas_calceolata.AAC.1